MAVSWAGKLYIHFRGLVPHNGILPGAKFIFGPSLAFYIGSVPVLKQWASAKLCGVQQRAPPIFGREAITLGIGPPSSSFFLAYSRRLDVYYVALCEFRMQV